MGRAPLRAAVLDVTGHFVRVWATFMSDIEASVLTRAHIQKTAQNAAIASTPLTSAVSPGVYRLSYYVRVTTAAGVSSAVQVTLAWTEGGQALTSVGVNVNGNTVSSFETRSIVVRIDAGTTPSFSTTYASNAAGAMRYEIDVMVELIPEA